MIKYFLFLLSTLSLQQAFAQNTRPNIVLIMTDDSGYSDIGCYGSEINTPNIDSLGYNGIRFKTCYNNAKCSPTRASLLTGFYPQKVGVGDLSKVENETDLPGYRGFLNPDYPTLAEILKDEGYLTIITGKWHLGGEQVLKKKKQGFYTPKKTEYAKWPIERGFSHFFGLIHGSSGVSIPWPERPYRLNKNVYDTKKHPKKFNATEAFTDFAIYFIKEARDTSDAPFFLYMPHTAPHAPLEAPAEMVEYYKPFYDSSDDYKFNREYRENKLKEMGIVPNEWATNYEYLTSLFYKRIHSQAYFLEETKNRFATYAAMVQQIDQSVGKVVQYLKEIGEFDNTIFIYLSDNGPSGAANMHAFGSPFIGAKTSLREGGTKTHLIMYWKNGNLQTGTISDQWVHVFDIMPTLLDMIDIDYPNKNLAGTALKPEGISVMPNISEGKIIKRKFLFWDLYGQKSVIFKQKWKWYKDYDGLDHLYDLEKDGTETLNLANKYPRILAKLKKAHQQFVNENNVVPYEKVLEAQKKKK